MSSSAASSGTSGSSAAAAASKSHPPQSAGIQTPHKHDVLLGRGLYKRNHHGNAALHSAIQKTRPMYRSVPKHQKIIVARSIVHAVRMQDPPGRFLERGGDGGDGGGKGGDNLWYEVPFDRVVVRVMRSFWRGTGEDCTNNGDGAGGDARGNVGAAATGAAANTSGTRGSSAAATAGSAERKSRSPQVSNMGPLPSGFSMDFVRTKPTYTTWLDLEEGATLIFSGYGHKKGHEGHEEHLCRLIFQQAERNKKRLLDRPPKTQYLAADVRDARFMNPKQPKEPYLAADVRDARPLNPFEMKVARANMKLFGAPAKIEQFYRDDSFDMLNPSPDEIYPQGNYSKIREIYAPSPRRFRKSRKRKAPK